MGTSHTVHLPEPECWSLLEGHVVARLAVDVGGQPDIFPLNYVVDGRSLVFRTGAGTKLAAAVLSRHVAFEIDGMNVDGSVWSVVVKGIAHEITDMEERFDMDELPLYPWVVSEKPNFVRIEPQSVTGRRFSAIERDEDYHPGAPRLRPD